MKHYVRNLTTQKFKSLLLILIISGAQNCFKTCLYKNLLFKIINVFKMK